MQISGFNFLYLIGVIGAAVLIVALPLALLRRRRRGKKDHKIDSGWWG